MCHEGPPTRSRWGGYHLARQAWPPGAERRLVPAKSNLKPQTTCCLLEWGAGAVGVEARCRGWSRRGGGCSDRGWSMPYGVMCTAKGPTTRCSLWGWMSLRDATARVSERPSLIHTASACDAAGLRQSVIIPVIVRLWMVSDTLVGGMLLRGVMWSSLRARALRLASCRCWASFAGVCTPAPHRSGPGPGGGNESCPHTTSSGPCGRCGKAVGCSCLFGTVSTFLVRQCLWRKGG